MHNGKSSREIDWWSTEKSRVKKVYPYWGKLYPYWEYDYYILFEEEREYEGMCLTSFNCAILSFDNSSPLPVFKLAFSNYQYSFTC